MRVLQYLGFLAVTAVSTFLLLGCWPSTEAVKIDSYSFNGPFDEIDAQGKRKLPGEFVYGGSTEVMKHFVRLTPDRQSKSGYIWREEVLASDEFTAVVGFRISGQGQKWFGDGIGLWVTQHAKFVAGLNHGFTEKYIGFGVILDTFKNTDHSGGHRDVSLMVNNGRMSLDEINRKQKIGCDANLRYHEGQDAFDPVYSMARIQIQVKGSRISIKIDEKGSGVWKSCYDGDMDLPSGWTQKATIGLTAATGALADNHDILSMNVFNEMEDSDLITIDSDAMIHSMSKDYDKWINSQSCGEDCKISILEKKLQDFHVDMEHKLKDLKDKTLNNLAKLKEKESENNFKILEMQQRISDKMDKKLEGHLSYFGDSVSKKIAKEVEIKVVAASGGWKIPLFVLAMVICGGSVYVYQKYQKLRKSHLL